MNMQNIAYVGMHVIYESKQLHDYLWKYAFNTVAWIIMRVFNMSLNALNYMEWGNLID